MNDPWLKTVVTGIAPVGQVDVDEEEHAVVEADHRNHALTVVDKSVDIACRDEDGRYRGMREGFSGPDSWLRGAVQKFDEDQPRDDDVLANLTSSGGGSGSGDRQTYVSPAERGKRAVAAATSRGWTEHGKGEQMDAWLNKFDPDQPRDADGKFTSGGGSSGEGQKKPAARLIELERELQVRSRGGADYSTPAARRETASMQREYAALIREFEKD